MKVQKLILRNFRNIEECTFVPDPQLNFLIGKNGQGKTSFLEALGYLATLRSFRGSKTQEVIRWGAQASEVLCTIAPNEPEGGEWQTELKLVLEDTTKVAFINGKPYRSSTQYLSQRFGSFELGFHTVIFNPSDHDLVRGEPATRRSYLDRVLAAEDVEYLKALQKFKRVLEQRNAILKSSQSPSRDVLMGFTEPMARYSAILARKRLEWIERLSLFLNNVLHQIIPNAPELRLIHLSSWVPNIENLSFKNNNLTPVHFAGHGPLPSLELLEQQFWNRVSFLETAEWKARHTLVGPHRDDWTFYLDDHVLKGHGSQGEVRSALLALKLSEIELFRKTTGHRPLFLLDDFSSELDRERRSFLLRFLSDTDLQVFVTTTEDISDGGKKFWVVNGSLKEDGHDHRTGTTVELE